MLWAYMGHMGVSNLYLFHHQPSDHKALRASRRWAPWSTAASATASAAQSLGITVLLRKLFGGWDTPMDNG